LKLIECRHALVTGGAGFIGSGLVRELLNRNLAVTVLDNLSTGERGAVDRRARFVEGDVRSESDVRNALADVDCVCHLAARVSVRDSFAHFVEDVDTNLMGTCNLLRCLPPDIIKRFVLASTMAVYADASGPDPISEYHTLRPISPYGVGKLSAELICSQVLSQKAIPFTALRYFNTYGPGQRFTPYVGVITIFVTRLLKGEAPQVFGDGAQQRDFVHVDDIVAGTIAALSGPPGVYNLGTGRNTSVLELAELLVERINPSVGISFAPAEAGELRNSVADISAAKRYLGYHPQRSLRRDIESVIDYIKHSPGT
jgi:UDP-glucose 4-epimerase